MASKLRASWGVFGSCTAVTGVVVGLSGRREGSVQTETDENGTICAVFIYDETDDINCDVQVKADIDLPRIGASVNIGGFDGYIKSAEYTEQNTAYCKIHIVANAHREVYEAVVTN